MCGMSSFVSANNEDGRVAAYIMLAYNQIDFLLLINF